MINDGRLGTIPRPDLLGALVIKSCAATSDRTAATARHREDLACLHALVADPAKLARDLTKKDRQRLRRAPSPTWEVLTDPASRAAAQLTHRYLTAA